MSFQIDFDDASLRIGGVDYGCGIAGSAAFEWDRSSETYSIVRIIVHPLALHRPNRILAAKNFQPCDQFLFDSLSEWLHEVYQDEIEEHRTERLGRRGRRNEHALTKHDLL